MLGSLRNDDYFTQHLRRTERDPKKERNGDPSKSLEKVIVSFLETLPCLRLFLFKRKRTTLARAKRRSLQNAGRPAGGPKTDLAADRRS